MGTIIEEEKFANFNLNKCTNKTSRKCEDNFLSNLKNDSRLDNLSSSLCRGFTQGL